MPFCCVSKCSRFGNGFCPCRAVGKWSMEEHLWYFFFVCVCCRWCYRWLQLQMGSGTSLSHSEPTPALRVGRQISAAAWIFHRGTAGYSTPLWSYFSCNVGLILGQCLVFLGVSYSFQLRYYLLFLVQISLHHSVRFRLFEYLRRRFLGVLTLGDCWMSTLS